MGVPAFFRWLSRKYPSIVVHCVEEKGKILNGVKIPVDSSKPNPNNVEFDNLYLDMNGIIHPCCHPENKPAPKNEEEMMVAIFEYIDRIFSICRPRRLLYMAIDGVAPRAKMNQQRSRRFRASKEGVEKAEEISRIREDLSSRGIELPAEKPKEEHFDSNCITPGTPFMDRLAKCLHYYIHDRLNSDPGWRDIEVILSDANVPGEGEHKIMDYIRRQRANPQHDPNTRHCLCGADADLIMLGLATHEPNFTIIREEFKPNQPRPCEICAQLGHEMKDCTGAAKEKQGEFDELEKPLENDVEFIFIRLNVLREYLSRELEMTNLPFKYDFERAVDDWVFMCFFVGNDFLPHLPSLEIREGAIDRLVRLYKDAVYRTGGFITDSGNVSLNRVQLILTELGKVEDEIFKKRQESELVFRQRQKDRKKRMRLENDRPAWTPGGSFSPRAIGKTPSPVHNVRQEAYQMRMMSSSSQDKAKAGLAAMLKPGESPTAQNSNSGKRKCEDDDSDEEPADDVRLWEDGWKDRYYEIKFEIARDNYAFRHKVAAAYVEGLCWVLRYYYQGCASWNWYFPYHYAPFASDFLNVGDLNIDFKRGTQPFKPLEQLMGVFPAASRQHVPEPWGELMLDPESPIIDFYPIDFKVDLNGKKYAWQGVALLPFVEEKRLLKALASVYPLLTGEEKRRNVRGKDRLYVRQGHGGYDYLLGLYDNSRNKTIEIDLNPSLFFGMGGKVLLADNVIGPNETIMSPLLALPHIPKNVAICICFMDPGYPEDFLFPAKRLKNAVDPPKVLKPGEMPVTNNRGWRPQAGMAPARQRAYLSDSGHRMMNHSMNSSYSEVPPPNMYGKNSRPSNSPGAGIFGSPPIIPWTPPSPYGFYSGQQQQQSGYSGSSSSNQWSTPRGGYQSYGGSSYSSNSRESWGPMSSGSYDSRGGGCGGGIGGGGGGGGSWARMSSNSSPQDRDFQARRSSYDPRDRDDHMRSSQDRRSYPPSDGGGGGGGGNRYSSYGRY